MKMNDTVARIVDLMFENVEMNEEVAALRDEVMNNCQERYSDLVESGVAEDDAVAAVIESLKGMEDVIGQYSKKSRKAAASSHVPEYRVSDEAETAEVGGERHMILSAREIHRIEVTLVNEDVCLEPSDDDDYHILWDAEEDPLIQVRAEDGVLCVERNPGEWKPEGHKRQRIHIDATDGMDNPRIRVNGRDIDFDNVSREVEKTMDGVGSMLENLGRSLGRMFQSIRTGFGGGDGVTIRIPHGAMPHVKLLTTSGDLEVQNVALSDLSIVTTSGDIDVDLAEDEHLQRIEMRSTSGDIEVTAYAEEMIVSSTSGDVQVEGRCSQLTVNTISGDIDVCAAVESIAFKAVSGDVDMEFTTDAIRRVNGSTISGDIDVDLPAGIGGMGIHTSTRSGDVTTRYSTNGYGPTVNGSVSSMSGDITIR
ncbi:MAG: DUF4097 family beta strand repeat protein [Clostridia bacterium]|nr:DUF4097 family beta strand repeat protein [Clostridia bacterium]